MIYGSVCSGIEAATAAWHPLHWTPAFFSEIEAFPRSVLAHHYPHVPAHGDFTTIGPNDYRPIQLLAGGTPCQDFSVAGLRAGIAGDRGNLTLEFVRLLDRLKPRWFVWENVPGVLSSDGGRAFSAFLGALGQLGYGFAYRVLDAQFFGVPQRRRRVYVVGYLGNWRAPAAVLFERESLRGDIAPSRKKGKNIAGTLSARAKGGGGLGTDFELDVASTLDAAQGSKWGSNQWVDQGFALPVGFNASEDGTGRGTPLVPDVATTLLAGVANGGAGHGARSGRAKESNLIPEIARCVTTGEGFRLDFETTTMLPIAFNARQDPDSWNERTGPLDTDGGTQAVAFAENQRAEVLLSDTAATESSGGGGKPGQGYPATLQSMRVRRLTPRECERLMGFPDDYTLVQHRGKPAADGPRYKALGNSMAVPVMRWIGERIDIVNALVR